MSTHRLISASLAFAPGIDCFNITAAEVIIEPSAAGESVYPGDEELMDYVGKTRDSISDRKVDLLEAEGHRLHKLNRARPHQLDKSQNRLLNQRSINRNRRNRISPLRINRLPRIPHRLVIEALA